MRTILCFGDSNTWGFNPDATATSPFPIRHAPNARWTGVLAHELGEKFRVVEEGQNGRTTVHDDPFVPCRNGRDVLPGCLESQKPIDVVVLMLGTNDLKATFAVPPGEIAAGVGVLARMILRSDASPLGGPPTLLLVCPPKVGSMESLPELAEKFAGATERSSRFPFFYERLAKELGCAYLNAQPLMTPSPIDPLHFGAESHASLGRAIAAKIREMF